MNKGILLVFVTAVVSGFSVFLNAFAAKGLNPFLLTTLKNVLVASMLLCVLILLSEKRLRKIFEPKLLPKLLAIGLIGGSLPFFIFFYALSQLSPADAGFIHKTLFIWASIFAFVLLKEKPKKSFLFAALLLLAGNYLLAPIKPSLNLPSALVLLATILWAIENVIAKKVLNEYDIRGTEVAFARMFYGSCFMLLGMAAFMPGVLLSTFSLNPEQFAWVIITAILLFFYVITYYNGLKYLAVHKATSMLLLAQPITLLLSSTTGSSLAVADVIGAFLILAGICTLFGFSFLLNKLCWKVPSWAKQKS